MEELQVLIKGHSIVDKETGCWNWQRYKNHDGYGYQHWGKRMQRAHRLSYEAYNGSIPKRLHILHICDNPSCVNPEHLQAGTHLENMQDMAAKGRGNGKGVSGEKHWYAKLTWVEVREIREQYAKGGTTYRTLAEVYNVHTSHIGRIINNTLWVE